MQTLNKRFYRRTAYALIPKMLLFEPSASFLMTNKHSIKVFDRSRIKKRNLRVKEWGEDE